MSTSTQPTSQTSRTNTWMLIGIIMGVLVGMMVDSIPPATVGGLIVGAAIDHLRYHLNTKS